MIKQTQEKTYQKVLFKEEEEDKKLLNQGWGWG